MAAGVSDTESSNRGELTGAWAVVTGGSKNIGRAVAALLSERGANVVMCARDEAHLTEAARELHATTGGVFIPVVCDVAEADDRRRLVDAAHSAADGPIDILVNNAYAHAATADTDILEIPAKAWDLTVAANLVAPYELARSFGRPMREAGRGCVVNVVAGPGLLPVHGWAPYGVTTAALWMLTRYLALECAPSIRVNAVCPGTIHPESEYRPYARDVLLPTVPMGRIGGPDEVAEAVAFLVSPRASYTTGALLTVNGGRLW